MKPIRPLEASSFSVVRTDAAFQLGRMVVGGGRRLLVKCATADYPTPAEEALLQREFRFFADLSSRRTVQPTALMMFEQKVAACFKDVDARVLSHDLHSGPGSTRLATIVRDLCGILLDVHRKGMVLIGLTPRSVVLDEHDRLILSGALLAQPVGLLAGIEPWLEPTYLPYMAPEVVGRTPLLIDQRADLYSLGVILYELMCRTLPFPSSDPADLIQSHLARQPKSPREYDQTLSEEMSQLILRLLSKDPADRFSSVVEFEREFTLRTDPAARATVWEAAEPSAGEESTFAVPGELYGRDGVVSDLLRRIERRRVRPELVVVEGEAGVGKTALARGLQAAWRPQRPAVFAWGRFRQAQATSPLSGWASALGTLAHDILMRSTGDELAQWATKVRPRLGANAPWIAALVPEWAVILSCAPMAAGSMLDSSSERLALAVRALLGVFASDDAPVVLILDDLQWADASSLKLLELLLCNSEPLNLFVLALTRPDDGEGTRGALERALASASVSFDRLQLDSLTTADLDALVRDTFREGLEGVRNFVALLQRKTDGSPLFVREFLGTLVRRRLLERGPAEGVWRWNEEVLETLPLPDKVATLLATKIVDLPTATKEIVLAASVLGQDFVLGDLENVLELERQQVETAVHRLIGEGMVLALRTGWDNEGVDAPARAERPTHAFVHDRVLEACQSLMSAEQRDFLHLRIGRSLARNAMSGGMTLRVAGHLSAGRRFVQDHAELLDSANVSLRAGQEAKRRGAFSQALSLIESGLSFLERAFASESSAGDAAERAWQVRPELSLALHEEGAENALLSGHLELMHELCDRIVEHTHEPLAKVAAYDIRVSGLKAAKRFADAVTFALEILAALDVKFAKRPHLGHVLTGFFLTSRKLPKRSADLLALPRMTDSRLSAVARIIQTVYPAAYLGRPELFPLLVYRHVNDALEHGNSEHSGVTYNALAAVFCAMERFEKADELGRVGLALVEEGSASRYRARAFSVYYFLIYPWRNPLWTAVPHYQEGIRDGIAVGDFEFASYLMTFESLARLHSGDSLPTLHQVLERYRDQLHDLGQERSILMQSMLCQISADLRAGTRKGPVLCGPFYDEAAMLPQCLDPLDENLVFQNYFSKLIVHSYLRNPEDARRAAREGRKVVAGAAFGSYLGPVFSFYSALAELDARDGPPDWKEIRRTVRRLRRYAKGAPSTFANKYHLVSAGLARQRGHFKEAARHFEKATELALAHGCVHEAGLAQVRAATFYLEHGMSRLARHCLREARHSFQRWGAGAVVMGLEEEFATQFVYLGSDSAPPHALPSGSSREILDYQTLLKSSQAISSETVLSRLMERLLHTIVEHAGAQRVLLVLEHEGQLYVESEFDVNSPHREFSGTELMESSSRLAVTVVRYAARTREAVVLADASRAESFARDPYLSGRRVKSLLCAPILNHGRLLGLIYLENNEVSHLFSPARLEVVNLLTTQAAISIANVRSHRLQIEAHQAKISPHFLFNALSSIAALTVTDGPTAERAVIQLAALYRYILTSSAEHFVTLDQELEIVRSYLELEKLRYGSKLDFLVERYGEPIEMRIPALVIQPIVENSIRHGIGRKVGGGRVSVLAQVEPHRCWILVEDDGDGPSKSSTGTGFGLKSIRERLAIAYGDRFSLSVTQRLGWRVEIEIPLDPDEPPSSRSSLLAATGRS